MATGDKGLVDIDLGRLDEEWIDQPKLYYEYATRLAEAKDSFDRAKAALDVTEAEVEFEVRDNPKVYGLTLPLRESAVKQKATLHEKTRKAVRKVNRCKYRVNMLDAAVSALEHRKRALEKLVDLHGQSYFARPVSKNLDKDGNEAARLRKRKARKGASDG